MNVVLRVPQIAQHWYSQLIHKLVQLIAGNGAGIHAHTNQAVDLYMGSVLTSGLMRGVNVAGALLLETDKGLEVFHGGEVSLRGAR